MFDGFLPLFLDGGKGKPRGKRGTDLTAHILGRVTSDYGSGLADYITFVETLHYWCGCPTDIESIILFLL